MHLNLGCECACARRARVFVCLLCLAARCVRRACVRVCESVFVCVLACVRAACGVRVFTANKKVYRICTGILQSKGRTRASNTAHVHGCLVMRVHGCLVMLWVPEVFWRL